MVQLVTLCNGCNLESNIEFFVIIIQLFEGVGMVVPKSIQTSVGKIDYPFFFSYGWPHS